ncbi:MAG: D-ribose pyranase [Bacteroidales bacterium]|nr:D-ribose pyranase [Bacteroidales bacterium]
MKEVGIINRDIAAVISEQGHRDLLMVTDAGFAIPSEVEVIDLSLSENVPMVLEVLKELEKYFSVEKMYMSEETREVNPSHFEEVSRAFGSGVEVETLPHMGLKKLSREVKAAIRTGDFTAYGNVILVSGAGDRWYLENSNH